jgi:hypothetical protein
MHDVVTVGIPLLAILAGVIFNRNDVKELRAEMNARFNKVEDHLGRIDADLRQFYHLTGKLEARMDSLEKGR